VKKSIAAYVAERDAMLLKCDVDELEAFQRRHGIPVGSCREVSEIILHKTRTAAVGLPADRLGR
jgi:hypothetical protein